MIEGKIAYGEHLALLESNGVWEQGQIVKSQYNVDLDEDQDPIYCITKTPHSCVCPVSRKLLLRLIGLNQTKIAIQRG